MKLQLPFLCCLTYQKGVVLYQLAEDEGLVTPHDATRLVLKASKIMFCRKNINFLASCLLFLYLFSGKLYKL